MPFPQTRRAHWYLGLAAIVALSLGFLSSTSPAYANEQTVGERIVAVAKQYDGTWQGQCWTFVKKVVEEATGRTMGFGYRDGYLAAGAVEVPLAEATTGDIIQLADDNNNGPGANYPGLHSAIVITNHGDGTFTVIDSNSQWTEMVRIHEYNPVASASRYSNITARAYRIGSVEPGTPAPGIAQPELGINDRARVDSGGDYLNVRAGAGTHNHVIGRLAHGTEVTVLSEPVSAGAYTWVQVELSDGQLGWVATRYLTLIQQRAPATSDGDVDDIDPPAPGEDDGETPEPDPVRDFRIFAPGLSSNTSN